MSHGANKTSGSTAWQTRVCIERNDVSHSRNRFRRVSFDSCKGGTRRPAKKLIEFMQFSALAFPSHPFLFAFVPQALTVEEKKPVTAARWRTVACVQVCDALDSSGHQGFIARQTHAQAGQQREAHVPGWVSQMVNFEPLDLFFDSRLRSKQSGNCDERAQLCRHSLFQLETRSSARSEEIGDRAVDQSNSQIRCRDCCEQA